MTYTTKKDKRPGTLLGNKYNSARLHCYTVRSRRTRIGILVRLEQTVPPISNRLHMPEELHYRDILFPTTPEFYFCR